MDRQEIINVLAEHFENFNDRIKEDFLFSQVISQMVDGGKDVYQIIDSLIQVQHELINIISKYEGDGK